MRYTSQNRKENNIQSTRGGRNLKVYSPTRSDENTTRRRPSNTTRNNQTSAQTTRSQRTATSFRKQVKRNAPVYFYDDDEDYNAYEKSAKRGSYDSYNNNDQYDNYESYDNYDEYDYDEKLVKKAKRSKQSRQSNQSTNTKRSKTNKKKNKTLKNDIFAIILLALQGALSLCFIIVMAILNVLPLGWFIVVIALLLILWGAVFFSQLKRVKKVPLIGKILSIILCLVLIIGNYYVIITNRAIDKVTEETVYNYTYLDVAVLASDPAQTIQDAKDYTFGTQAKYQPLNLNKAIEEIEEEIGKSITTSDYDTVLTETEALYQKKIPAIIYNRNFKSTILEKYENFESETRIIKTVTIKDAINIKSNSTVDVVNEPFFFYISGNDEYGELTIEGRSDVNMLVAVNPITRQVLMVTTPRDYYVELPGVSGGARDKLTHAGVYGTQCQLDTFNNLYDIDIDYYCKVNFSSLIDIVDAIGGVDVYNEMEFEFDNSDGLIIPQGNIHLDGYTALCFCRERHSFEDGDAARARHQQAVIEAIINKLLSTTGLTVYSQLIKTLEKCCVTNMPKESISALVKKQLAEGGSWNITKAAAEGYGTLQTTFSMGNMPLYVTIPYVKSIQNVKTMFDQLERGEEVTALQLNEEGDDYSLVCPIEELPETSEQDEDGYTIVRESLTDLDGNVFGQLIKHIDEENDNKVVKTEYVDNNGNPLSADEVEELRNRSTQEDTEDTQEDTEDTQEDTEDTEEDTEEEV